MKIRGYFLNFKVRWYIVNCDYQGIFIVFIFYATTNDQIFFKFLKREFESEQSIKYHFRSGIFSMRDILEIFGFIIFIFYFP